MCSEALYLLGGWDDRAGQPSGEVGMENRENVSHSWNYINLPKKTTEKIKIRSLSGRSTLPETNSSHLKMDGWNMSFLLGPGLFSGGYDTFREI